MKQCFEKTKGIFAILLAALLLVAATGCGKGTGESTQPTESRETTAPTETTQPTQPEATKPEQTDAVTLEALREQMAGEEKLFAVAYLGYMTMDHETVYDFLDAECAASLEQLPFLTQIPETNIITNASQGEVYCILLADSQSVMQVYSGAVENDAANLLYEGSGEDAFLLVCNAYESPDTRLNITDKEGITTTWDPKLDDYLFVEQPRYASGATPSLDFSPYNAMLLTYYESMLAEEGWKIPTKEELVNTSWTMDGYDMNGNYYCHSITFHEDTADVTWNPGYGETQEYLDAQWDWEAGDVGILTIDFAEFAGVRKYNMLVNWDEVSAYIAVDATAETITWDSERLYRFLIYLFEEEQDVGMELVGNWERVRTEVEGDVSETPSGQVTVSIIGTSPEDLCITYTDNEFTDKSYSEKPIIIESGEDNMGFGEVAWVGQVDHTGTNGQTFTLAIVNGELVIRNFAMFDGTYFVSYEYFRWVS